MIAALGIYAYGAHLIDWVALALVGVWLVFFAWTAGRAR